ncbi:hypothetical protein WOLCODRAFT_165724 [Wolfiporia cocos MD-104 SS10]|uniref:Uncharacterized protein n=1 Tax=Wolfiporia cocos (strain MD-104) TaxID=742152 RepID=A0A2H3J7F2_WOLCO|nr:hypothetical protein WOLCODRAFT_165724 [Wolfiporia cocos MD-104 SS10]
MPTSAAAESQLPWDMLRITTLRDIFLDLGLYQHAFGSKEDLLRLLQRIDRAGLDAVMQGPNRQNAEIEEEERPPLLPPAPRREPGPRPAATSSQPRAVQAASGSGSGSRPSARTPVSRMSLVPVLPAQVDSSNKASRSGGGPTRAASSIAAAKGARSAVPAKSSKRAAPEGAPRAAGPSHSRANGKQPAAAPEKKQVFVGVVLSAPSRETLSHINGTGTRPARTSMPVASDRPRPKPGPSRRSGIVRKRKAASDTEDGEMGGGQRARQTRRRVSRSTAPAMDVDESESESE